MSFIPLLSVTGPPHACVAPSVQIGELRRPQLSQNGMPWTTVQGLQHDAYPASTTHKLIDAKTCESSNDASIRVSHRTISGQERIDTRRTLSSVNAHNGRKGKSEPTAKRHSRRSADPCSYAFGRPRLIGNSCFGIILPGQKRNAPSLTGFRSIHGALLCIRGYESRYFRERATAPGQYNAPIFRS